MKRQIDRNILLKLKFAPFSLRSTELRDDKLTCTECTERTGYHPTLFENESDETDACMNRPCFELKLNNWIKLQQDQISQIAIKDGASAKYVAPLVTQHWGDSQQYPKAINRSKYTEIEKKLDICPKMEFAVIVNGDRVGQKMKICRSADCDKHGHRFQGHSTSSDGNKSEAQIEKEKQDRLIRKEEIFDVKIGEAVRQKVLELASAKFAENLYFGDEEFLVQIIARMWETIDDFKTKHIIIKIMQSWVDDEIDDYSQPSRIEFLRSLSLTKQIAALFLFVNSHRGAMYYDSWSSQKEIKEIAAKFGIDYQLIDAEERFAQAPNKHKELFEAYHQQILSGIRDAKSRVFIQINGFPKKNKWKK